MRKIINFASNVPKYLRIQAAAEYVAVNGHRAAPRVGMPHSTALCKNALLPVQRLCLIRR